MAIERKQLDLAVDLTTATNSPSVLVIHESHVQLRPDNRLLATYPAGGPIGAISQIGHLRTLTVAFSADWDGGDLTVSGTAPDGSPVSEVYPSTPGGSVVGVKVFSLLSGASQGGAGVTGHADIRIDTAIGVSNKPVRAFIKAAIDGAYDAFSQTDLVEGSFDTVSPHSNKTVEVWYTIDLAQNAHTHTLS